MSKSRYSNGIRLTEMTNEVKGTNPRAMVRRIWEVMAKEEDVH
jgi:hypothetical protein